MTAKITDVGARALEPLLGDGGLISANSPIEQEPGSTYMKYDELVVERTATGLRTKLMWRGTAMAYIDNGFFLERVGDSLTLQGVEGRMRLMVSSA